MSAESRTCTSCGAPLGVTAKFCGECGAPAPAAIRADEPAEPTPAVRPGRARPAWTTILGSVAGVAVLLAFGISQLQSHNSKTPSTSSASDSREDNGIVLANGNTLYGSEAKAYCERFAVDTTDLQTARACIGVGADITSAKADAEAAEAERQKQAERNFKEQSAAASDFRAAVKTAVGKDKYGLSDLVAVEIIAGQLVVETSWVTRETHNDPIADTDADATIESKSKYRKVCQAIKGIDPEMDAVVVNDDNERHACLTVLAAGSGS